jgi:hypothetical protein
MVRSPEKIRDNDYRQTRRRLRQERWKAADNSVTNAAIPDVGDEVDGVVFEGLAATKLERELLADVQLFPKNDEGKRVIPEAVNVRNANITSLHGTKLENLSVPEGAINGGGMNNKISWGKVDHPDVATKDWCLSKFRPI